MKDCLAWCGGESINSKHRSKYKNLQQCWTEKSLKANMMAVRVWMWTGRRDYIKCLGENSTYFWRFMHDSDSTSPAFHPVSSLWSAWSIVSLTHAVVFLIWTNMLTLKSLHFSLFILKEVTPPPPDHFFSSVFTGFCPLRALPLWAMWVEWQNCFSSLQTWVVIPCRPVMNFHIHGVF